MNEQKRTCTFAGRIAGGQCLALTENLCDKQTCKFYKSEKEWGIDKKTQFPFRKDKDGSGKKL